MRLVEAHDLQLASKNEFSRGSRGTTAMQRSALLGCAAAIMLAAPATIAFNPTTPAIGTRVRNANALRRGVLGHSVSRSERTCSFYPPVPPSAARSGTGLVVLRAKKRVSARRLEKMDREDPEYQAILARQKVSVCCTAEPHPAA